VNTPPPAPPVPVAVNAPLPLHEQRFAVVDVETSGLSAARHRILQIAVVTVLGDGTVVDRWASEVRPVLARLGLGRVGPSHIHGFTSGSLRHAPPWSVVAPELVRRLDGTVFCAHNAGFDWAFVQQGLRRAGYRPPDAARLCTMRLSRALDPERVLSHRLVDAAARHGISVDRPHDALADAEATARLLPRLLRHVDAVFLSDLEPFLAGSGTRWPASERPPLVERLRARLSRPAVQR
jgi:DNA polymerase III epsilon subunit-like protein